MNSDEIIFLLGAGASHEAGLKTSEEMTKALECLLANTWGHYKRLYNAVKAGILYGHALKGEMRNSVNIEEFVNVLTELSRSKDHPIYPFIASWNMELAETAGPDFQHVQELRKAIIKELATKWVNLEDSASASYYRNLQCFATELGSNLRVFSLNYDTCVERGCEPDSVFTGFIATESRTGKIWNDQLMSMDDKIKEPIRLYKLHGSIDWRDEDGVLVSHDSPTECDANNYQLIFGTENKMRYTEPYLYLLSEFREASYHAKLILCIGYSFQDAHVNSILNHAFKSEFPTKLLHVGRDENPNDENKRLSERKRIATAINVEPDKVEVILSGAKSFMENQLNRDFLETMFPVEEQPF